MGLLEPRANGTDGTRPTTHAGPPSMRLAPPTRPRLFAARSPLPLLPAGLERLHPHAADAIAAAIAPPGMGPPRPAAPRDSALDTAKSIRRKGEGLLGGDKAVLAKMNPEPDLIDFLPPQLSIGYKYFRNTVKAQQARRPEPAEPRAVRKPRAAPPTPPAAHTPRPSQEYADHGGFQSETVPRTCDDCEAGANSWPVPFWWNRPPSWVDNPPDWWDGYTRQLAGAGRIAGAPDPSLFNAVN